MAEYELPHFGQIPIGDLEEYYDVEIDFKGSEIQIDLNFEDKTIETSKLDSVKKIITNLERFNILNQTYIKNDYDDNEGDTVKTYLEHHIEEIDKEELSTLIDFDNIAIEADKQLLAKLKLVRVGIYPDSEDIFATFDYSIGQEITDHLVVINTDKDGKLNYMTIES
jgi:hypothetical protein